MEQVHASGSRNRPLRGLAAGDRRPEAGSRASPSARKARLYPDPPAFGRFQGSVRRWTRRRSAPQPPGPFGASASEPPRRPSRSSPATPLDTAAAGRSATPRCPALAPSGPAFGRSSPGGARASDLRSSLRRAAGGALRGAWGRPLSADWPRSAWGRSSVSLRQGMTGQDVRPEAGESLRGRDVPYRAAGQSDRRRPVALRVDTLAGSLRTADTLAGHSGWSQDQRSGSAGWSFRPGFGRSVTLSVRGG